MIMENTQKTIKNKNGINKRITIMKKIILAIICIALLGTAIFGVVKGQKK